MHLKSPAAETAPDELLIRIYEAIKDVYKRQCQRRADEVNQLRYAFGNPDSGQGLWRHRNGERVFLGVGLWFHVCLLFVVIRVPASCRLPFLQVF